MSKTNKPAGLPTFTMRELLEAGVHFGHNTRRWNPKMEQYIFGARHNTHILDLQQTVPMLYQALELMMKTAEAGGSILFVGTKHQAAQKIKETAKRCAQHYMNHRWLGGTLTNWKTISGSIKRLKELEDIMANPDESGLTKKELLGLSREHEKLDLAIGGIREMNGQPDLIFIIDTNREDIAIKEANKLGIPVIAVVDTNSNPDSIDYPIPGNDDALRAIDLYCRLASEAVLEGIQLEMGASGQDVKADAKAADAPAKDAPKAEDKPAEEASKEDSKADAKADAKATKDAPGKVAVEVKKKKTVKKADASDTKAEAKSEKAAEASDAPAEAEAPAETEEKKAANG